MIATLTDFEYKIDALERFLLSTESETLLAERLRRNMVKGDKETAKLVEHVLQVRTDKKRYIYLIGIVGLYGILEKFIQEILSGYAQVLGSCVNTYGNLPESFRKNHLEGSIDLLKAIREERYDLGVNETEVIGNLHSCLSNHQNYYINNKVFGYHRGNINFSKIEELVSRLAIRNFTSRLFRIARTQLPELPNGSPIKQRTSDEEVRSFFSPVDDLVERRNQLAHGDLITDDIESIELMRSRCGFIRGFGRAVVTVLQQEWITICIEAENILRMGKPRGVYGKNIVCLSPPVRPVSVGDLIAAKTSDQGEPVRFGKILSLQVNREAVETVEPQQADPFCARVPFRVKNNHRFFIVLADGTQILPSDA